MSDETETFEDQLDDSEMICPYCKDSYEPEGEDYNEEDHEIKCDACGMKYYARQIFTITHAAAPDCELNNEKHDYRMHKLISGREHPFCEKCGKCKPHES